ncbi:Mobile element protein [Mesobacillus thioparans]
MPLLQMKEVFTPLRLVGIKVFKDKEGYTYIKFWNKPRKKIFN